MESQPKNPEFRIDPDNFHPCNLRREAVIPKFLITVCKENQPGPQETMVCD